MKMFNIEDELDEDLRKAVSDHHLKKEHAIHLCVLRQLKELNFNLSMGAVHRGVASNGDKAGRPTVKI